MWENTDQNYSESDTFYTVEMVFKNIKQYLELTLQKKLKKYW